MTDWAIIGECLLLFWCHGHFKCIHSIVRLMVFLKPLGKKTLIYLKKEAKMWIYVILDFRTENFYDQSVWDLVNHLGFLLNIKKSTKSIVITDEISIILISFNQSLNLTKKTPTHPHPPQGNNYSVPKSTLIFIKGSGYLLS